MGEYNNILSDEEILSKEDNEIIKVFLDKNMPKSVNQKMQDMYIGYIDINGMQNMMKSMSEDRFEKLCNDIATKVDSIIYENTSYENNFNVKVDFHMFSDNMIFLCDNLQFLIERMGLLQRSLAVCLELTIKGGIDKGKIYKYKNRFVLGSGLISAYKIDNDYHNPAIKVASSLVNDRVNYVKKVSYDEYVVDYYKIASTLSSDFEFEELPYIKDLIEENLSQGYQGDVLHKYLWMKEYHNDYCSENHIKDMTINLGGKV